MILEKNWAQQGFGTTERKPFSHSSLITDLLNACSLPSALAVIKVKGHAIGNGECT